MQEPPQKPDSPLDPEHNPFAEADLAGDLAGEQVAAERASGDKLLAQVPTIGYLMLAHGVLVGAMGLFFALLFGLFAILPLPDMPDDGPEFPRALFGIYFFVFLILCFVPGVLQVIGGWKLIRKRGRIFALMAACIGLIAALTTFCAPTAIGLAVYALIVLCNPEVAKKMDGKS